MNYGNLYVNLLLKHGTEDKPDGYSERHHIIPKALGGGDEKENLVYLSARVHFLAHWILHRIHQLPETARALYGMADVHRRPDRKHMLSARRYEYARKAFNEFNHMKDPKHRERAARSAAAQWARDYDKMKASNAYMFDDPNHPMYMRGKTGDLHPRSKAVITPLGRFGSVRLAAKAHGVPHPLISRYCRSADHPDYVYE